MARVHTTDEIWAEFKTSAGNESLSVILGELVARHVDQYRSRRLRDGELDDSEILDALERARELDTDLTQMIARLERRLNREQTPARDWDGAMTRPAWRGRRHARARRAGR
jgi:predicted DNA-binding protein (UPF0278 family)